MNKLVLLASAASFATLALASSASAASFTGWYGGVEAGANWVPDQDAIADTSSTATAQFDTGWTIIGNAGYSFGPWRTELELGYRSNDLDAFSTYTDGGNVDQFTVMANALYDFNVAQNYQVSVGGGLGVDFVNYDNSSGWHSVNIKDSDSAFAWQLMAGVSRFVPSINADVVLNYRYLQTSDLTFAEYDGSSWHYDDYDNIDNHAVTLGLRWH